MSKFEGLTYLDMSPTDKGIQGNDVYKAYLFPLHTFFRVDKLDEKTLQLSSVDGDWLKRRLQDNPETLKHERIKGGFLLTAPPKDLQAFLKKHDETPGAFTQAMALHRKKPAEG